MPVKKTSFGPVAIVLRGAGSQGHDPRTIGSGKDVGLDIQVPVSQTANAFQISQPDGTVVYALNPGSLGTAITASGAVPVAGGNYQITAASAVALTVAPPTAAQNGVTMTFTSTTNFAHTISFGAGNLLAGTAGNTLATFAAFAGASLTVQASNGKWILVRSQGVTIS
jgi:hypothetical protein